MNQQAQKKEPVLDKGQISKFTAFYAKLDSDLAAAQRKIEGFLEKKQAYDEIDDWMFAQSATKEKKIEQKVEIERDLWVNVECPKTNTLNLDIGLGLWLECSFDEAKKFIPKAQELYD